jgi:NADPH:quinone reductase-like Zn-dependent oxidoreductase
MMASKSLIGVSMLKIGREKPEIISRILREVVALAEKKVLTPSADQEFSVSQLAEAHYALEQRKTLGKVVVKWQ